MTVHCKPCQIQWASDRLRCINCGRRGTEGSIVRMTNQHTVRWSRAPA